MDTLNIFHGMRINTGNDAKILAVCTETCKLSLELKCTGLTTHESRAEFEIILYNTFSS